MPLHSSRIILVTGAAGAALMAFAGFQLGRQQRHSVPALTLAANAPIQANSAPARPEAPPAGMPSMQQPNATTMPAEAAMTREAAATRPLAANTSAQSQTSPDFPKSRSLRPPPTHPSALTPKWPLAMQLADSISTGNATAFPQQIQTALQRVQDQFVKDVGGTDQNPADPAYASRWLAATMRADDMLRAQIGWEAFNAHSLALAKGAAAK